MKKRILSMLLALVMVACLLPTVAFAEDPVAQIDEQGYGTLQAAIDAAKSGDTVTLLKDATESVTIEKGKVITLELNGKTLTNDPEKNSYTAEADRKYPDTIWVKKGAALTVNGTGTVNNTTNQSQAVFNEGTVTLNGGSYSRTAAGGYVIVNHGAKMTINSDVTVTTTDNGSALVVNGYMFAEPSSNSKLAGNTRVSYCDTDPSRNAENPVMELAGGFFEGGKHVISNDHRGVMTVTGNPTVTAAVGSTNAFRNEPTAKAEIAGGTFTGQIKNSAENAQTLKISGGTFKGNIVVEKGENTLEITGGTFTKADGTTPNEDAKKYTNPELTQNEDGTIVDRTETADDAVAKVGNKVYPSLQEAVAACPANGTVTLLKDAEGSGVIVDNSITIDFGDHKYTVSKTPLAGSSGTESQAFQLLAGSNTNDPNTVTMKNGTIVLPETIAGLKMGIQNYTNLTLDGMTLDASNNSNISYVLSNNNGNTTLTGGTVLKAAEGKVAFDVYDYSSSGYGNVTVNVEDATIVGKFEVSNTEKANLVVSGGSFSTPIDEKYCADGFKPVQNSDGTYGVAKKLNITASPATLTGGGTVTLTVTSDVEGSVTVTCNSSDITVTGGTNGKYTAYLPNTTATYTFTATAGTLTDTCTVEVTRHTYIPPVKPVKPVTPVKPDLGLPFRDVHERDWYYDAVEYVYDHELMDGVGGGRFNPLGETTRGMIVTILYRMEGSPRVRSNDAYWWSDARVWAMEYGVSDGTNMTSAITREQLAAMLFRYAKLIGEDTSARSSLNRFADSEKVSSWAVDAMQWAVAEGIVNGKGSTLDPKSLATRAEVAAMFMRFDKLVG